MICIHYILRICLRFKPLWTHFVRDGITTVCQRGKSPKKLWISGILDGNRSGQFGVRNIICSREETEIYGVELSANTFDLFYHDNVSDEANDEADVTDVDLGLSEEQKQHLRELSNPNESFNDYGISLYLKIREEIKQFLNV